MKPPSVADEGHSSKFPVNVAEDERSFKDPVNVKRTQLRKAVRALQQLVKKQESAENTLFETHNTYMQLMFNVSYILKKPMFSPYVISLPHSLHSERSEVCFFSRAPQKKFKDLLLRENTIPGLTKVISIDKFKKKYQTHTDKQQLAQSFDLFLIDAKLVQDKHWLLGDQFFRRQRKRPITVRVKENKPGWDPVQPFNAAIRGTQFWMNTGLSVSVKIGFCSMTEDQLCENGEAVIKSVLRMLKFNPMQSISVQVTDLPSLPIWRRAHSKKEIRSSKKLAGSSVPSETGSSKGGISESEDTKKDDTSSVGETLDTHDIISSHDVTSEVQSDDFSEAESKSTTTSVIGAGDEDFVPTEKKSLPLHKSLKKRKGKVMAKDGKNQKIDL